MTSSNRPTVDHSDDRKAWLLVAAAAVTSLAAIGTFGWAMAYEAPGSFSAVAQVELQVPQLTELTEREAQDVGRGLCAELAGSDGVDAVGRDELASEVSRRYTISRTTGAALVEAAVTHLCPEAVETTAS